LRKIEARYAISLFNTFSKRLEFYDIKNIDRYKKYRKNYNKLTQY